MTAQLIKDVLLFRLDVGELRQVLEDKSMIQAVWEQLQSDSTEARRGRWMPHPSPLKIFHEEKGRGHVLQCRLFLWRYFREVEAANPLEREIRAQMLSLGLSGEADRRTVRYAPDPDTAADAAN